jgi:hypothetical protein
MQHDSIESFEIVDGRAMFADGSYGPVGWVPLETPRPAHMGHGMKKTATASLALAAVLALAGCSAASPGSATSASHDASSAKSTPVAPPVLTGDWTQSNAKSADSYQAATITGDAIEVDWITDKGATKSLYWAGTFTAPTTAAGYSFDSKNDTTKTAGAMLASGDATKTFHYADGVLSYSVSALGTTTTVELKHK